MTDEDDIIDDMMENEDVEEEMLLQDAMNEMQREDEQNQNNDEVEIVPELLAEEIELSPVEAERNAPKNKVKLLISLLNKNKFMIKFNFFRFFLTF